MLRPVRVCRRTGASVTVLLPALLAAGPACAQYEVEQPSPVWVRALIDARVVRGSQPPSWTDSGPGKLRHGGRLTENGFERVTRAELAQLVLEFGAALPWGVRAQAQLNFQQDVAEDDEPFLVEAFLRKEWGAPRAGFGLQAGLMNTPFSLEHTGPAWSPEYTISASALNSWLWEETSVAGLEGEWWREAAGLRFGVLAGAGYGPDQIGRLLSVRGWTMGDVLSGVNAELPMPSGERTEIFDERDDRLAAYASVSIGDAEERVSLRAGWFDNFGDQYVPGVWETRFTTFGAIWHPHPNIEVLAQYLDGEAQVYLPQNSSALQATYGLLSWHNRRHRVSFRYDRFELEDLDGGPNTAEKGQAWTAAWFWQFGLRHRLAFEYVWMDSRREALATPEPSQDGWQFGYRFRY